MSDGPIFTSLTPSEAAARDAAAENHRSNFAQDRVFIKAPTTGVEAAARLDELQKDSKWVDRLNSGDGPARKEFTALTELMVRDEAVFDPQAADALQNLPFGEITFEDNQVVAREAVAFVETQRQMGSNETLIAEMLDGSRTYTPELKAHAQEYWDGLSADPKFREALFRGEPWATRKFHAYSTIMAGGTKAA
jgi:hypothetical protein